MATTARPGKVPEPPDGRARSGRVSEWSVHAGDGFAEGECVVHRDSSNRGTLRRTAVRVALIDRDGSHVDEPYLDLVLPNEAVGAGC